MRVTEAAAIAAAKWTGKGEEKKADAAAVKEMRSRFNKIDFSGSVVIGEGAKDEAPELYKGEKVGTLRLRSGRAAHKVHHILESLAVTKMPKSGKPDELLAYEEINKDAIIKKVRQVVSSKL